MKTRIIIGIAAIAAVLAGCNKQDDVTDNTWNGEIRLSSGITAQTRSNNADVPDKQIAANKVVSFFVDDAGVSVTKKNLYENYEMTADGNGGFTKSDAQAEKMYYPSTGNGVDIYAFMTNGVVGGSFPAAAITHTVSDDQSVLHGDNYLASDLLYAAQKGITRSPDAVEMEFYHMLSKVEVAIEAGDGMTGSDLTGAVVTIENTQLKADFLPVKAADITVQDARAAMVTLTATDNIVAPITIDTSIELDAFDEATIYASAVVVPQTVAKGKRFIKVTLASGGELFYTISSESGLKLMSGYKYQFQITVNLSSLTVKSTIVDWVTGAPIDGTAELPGPKKPEDVAVGDFYMNDGTIWDKDDKLTVEQKAACIGIVFYKNLDGKTGKIVSLDEATSTQWSTEDAVTSATSDTDGVANTATILALGSYIADDTKYPAFAWCATKNIPAVAGIKWYLPATKELRQLYAAMSGLKWVASGAGTGEINDWGNLAMPNNASYANARTAFNGNFTSANGTSMDLNGNYWSSTEEYVDDSWYVSFINGSAYYDYKNTYPSVRVVSAF